MKIAITSTGPDLESAVDERFGRARYILITDPQANDFEVIDNSADSTARQGAGVQAAQMMADNGVGWVLTGHVGPKAFQVLNMAGIKIGTGTSGTCREVLERFRRGEFTAADVSSHW